MLKPHPARRSQIAPNALRLVREILLVREYVLDDVYCSMREDPELRLQLVRVSRKLGKREGGGPIQVPSVRLLSDQVSFLLRQ